MPTFLGKTGGVAFVPLGTLNVPGASDVLELRDAAPDVTLQLLVADIGTNVVIRFEGSIDGTHYFALENPPDRTITTNGTIAFRLTGQLRSVRGQLVSINGGSPTVVFSAAGR